MLSSRSTAGHEPRGSLVTLHCRSRDSRWSRSESTRNSESASKSKGEHSLPLPRRPRPSATRIQPRTKGPRARGVVEESPGAELMERFLDIERFLDSFSIFREPFNQRCVEEEWPGPGETQEMQKKGATLARPMRV